jgi:hypothetical protein
MNQQLGDPLQVIAYILFWPFILIGQILQGTQRSRPLALPPPPTEFIKSVEASLPKPPARSYSNVQRIKFIRNGRGRIQEMEIHREAREQ